MIGDTITTLAQCLLRERTYALIVSPAIADLQHGRRIGTPRHRLLPLWLGVIRVIAVAIFLDLAGDLRTCRRAALDAATDGVITGPTEPVRAWLPVALLYVLATAGWMRTREAR